MSYAIDASTLRIRHPNGNTVGTGFLVSSKLGVTCVHVIDAAGFDANGRVVIRFTGQEHKPSGKSARQLNQKSIL